MLWPCDQPPIKEVERPPALIVASLRASVRPEDGPANPRLRSLRPGGVDLRWGDVYVSGIGRVSVRPSSSIAAPVTWCRG